MLLPITGRLTTVSPYHSYSGTRVPLVPSFSRHEIVADDRVGLYHCIVRCVWKAFLCGENPLFGKNYDHRKECIRLRLQQLAAVSGIDICGYGVMSNHFPIVLRVRPDLAQGGSDEEVALCWRLRYAPRDEATFRGPGDVAAPSAIRRVQFATWSITTCSRYWPTWRWSRLPGWTVIPCGTKRSRS